MSYKPFTTKYTWQIIDDIKEYLEETNKGQTTLDTLDLCHLIGEIEELNDKNRELFNKNKQLKSQLQQKEKIIKEVREYIIDEQDKQSEFSNFYNAFIDNINISVETILDMLDKEVN